MSNIVKHQPQSSIPALQMDESELISVLQTSLYPGASLPSIKMVVGYCRAAQLDPLQKPVHIVPMWDKNTKGMRDVVMPGVGLYRTQASRTGQYVGASEPEFGPDVDEVLDGVKITYPKWCKVIVRRQLESGAIAEFPSVEFWKENYATATKDSAAPNAMWKKRPYGQLSKCAEAQALRKAFPEFGAQPTAEEMEGKSIDGASDVVDVNSTSSRKPASGAEAARAAQQNAASHAGVSDEERTALLSELDKFVLNNGLTEYSAKWQSLTKEQRRAIGPEEHNRLKELAQRNDEAREAAQQQSGGGEDGTE